MLNVRTKKSRLLKLEKSFASSLKQLKNWTGYIKQCFFVCLLACLFVLTHGASSKVQLYLRETNKYGEPDLESLVFGAVRENLVEPTSIPELRR